MTSAASGRRALTCSSLSGFATNSAKALSGLFVLRYTDVTSKAATLGPIRSIQAFRVSSSHFVARSRVRVERKSLASLVRYASAQVSKSRWMESSGSETTWSDVLLSLRLVGLCGADVGASVAISRTDSDEAGSSRDGEAPTFWREVAVLEAGAVPKTSGPQAAIITREQRSEINQVLEFMAVLHEYGNRPAGHRRSRFYAGLEWGPLGPATVPALLGSSLTFLPCFDGVYMDFAVRECSPIGFNTPVFRDLSTYARRGLWSVPGGPLNNKQPVEVGHAQHLL